MIQTITANDINPCLRMINTHYTHENFSPIMLKSYSHRIYFCQSGKGTFVVNGVHYPMKKNSLIMIPNGFLYELHSQKVNIHWIMLVFTYTPFQEQWYYSPDSPLAQYFDDNAPRERVVFTDMPALNNTICLHNMERLLPYLTECLQEHRLCKIFHNNITSILIQFIIQMIIRNYILYGASPFSGKTDDYVDAIINYIHENYSGQDISNKSIGKLFNLHPNYISSLIRERTSYSLHQYVNNVRIESAIRLFNTTKMSIAEVGNAVGYITSSYFSKYFKMKTGKSPSEYYYKFHPI